MTDIKNIIFDFGGVLLDWNPRYLYRGYFDNENEMEYFLSTVCTPEWNELLDAGRPFKEAVADLQAQWPQYKEAILMYWQEWPQMVRREFTDTVHLLNQLKDNGYHIYGLTNWSAETIQLMLPRYDFFRQLDGMVVSGEENMLKPSPEIYKLLLSRYHLQASESIFIDDNQKNVAGAEAVGIHGIMFDNVPHVIERLKYYKVRL